MKSNTAFISAFTEAPLLVIGKKVIGGNMILELGRLEVIMSRKKWRERES